MLIKWELFVGRFDVLKNENVHLFIMILTNLQKIKNIWGLKSFYYYNFLYLWNLYDRYTVQYLYIQAGEWTENFSQEYYISWTKAGKSLDRPQQH